MIQRYSNVAINKIFQETNKYEIWLKIEKLLLKFLSIEGLISEKAYLRLENELTVNVVEVAAEELLTKHDFAAFINVISRKSKQIEKKYIHYGLTTSDVVDTANAFMLKQVNDLLCAEFHHLLHALKALAIKYKDLPQIGRTHGIHAEITSFGYKFAIFYDDLSKLVDSFYEARQNLECAKISGSVGTFSNTGILLQDFIAENLELFSSECSTQILSRERYATYFSSLNLIAQSINKIAFNLRDLCKTEINEVAESFGEEQIGSSSMPHKKNPVTLENICGLSRLLKGYADASLLNIPLLHERDISHSSVERVLFVDATNIIYHITSKLTNVLNNLVVKTENIKKNIELTKGNIFSQAVLLKLIQKTNYSREELHEQVKKLSFKSMDESVQFKEILLKSELAKHLDEKDLTDIFDISSHLRHIDDRYKKIFKSEKYAECFETIIWNRQQINAAISLLANKLNNYYGVSEEEVMIIAALDGAVMFMGQLLPKLYFNCNLVTTKISFYGEKTSFDKSKKYHLDFSLEIFKNKRVLVIDDLLDTGGSLKEIIKALNKADVSEIKTAVLFAKEWNEKQELNVDWFGLTIPDKWVAGYGIDSNKKYRNVDFLGVLKEEFH